MKEAEEGGIPDAGNLNPDYGFDAQWDSNTRWQTLESQGVVAEVLFPNGQPFQVNRFEDVGRAANPELESEGRRACNRWVADFCAESPVVAPVRRWCRLPTSTRRSLTSVGPRSTVWEGS